MRKMKGIQNTHSGKRVRTSGELSKIDNFFFFLFASSSFSSGNLKSGLHRHVMKHKRHDESCQKHRWKNKGGTKDVHKQASSSS